MDKKKTKRNVLINNISILTPSEAKLWKALKETDTVGFAAQKAGLQRKTAYNMLYRLRRKYLKARRFVNLVEGAKRYSDLIRMVMTSRMEIVREEKAKETASEQEENQA